MHACPQAHPGFARAVYEIAWGCVGVWGLPGVIASSKSQLASLIGSKEDISLTLFLYVRVNVD